MSPPTVFYQVWYRPAGQGRRPLSLACYHDVGTLTIADQSLVFQGRHDRVAFESIDHLAFGAQDGDFINTWVQVKSGETGACFADGGWWGWRGHTRKILRAIIDHFPETPGETSTAPCSPDQQDNGLFRS